MMRYIFSIIITAIAAATAMADNPSTIIDHIKSSGRHTVEAPEALVALLVRGAAVPDGEATADGAEHHDADTQSHATPSGGWRIQVFLDNNPSTARSAVRRRAAQVSSRFPELRTYITFNSPYWRLRCGDFTSQAAAEAAASELRAAFPRQAKEIRVVRDRINRK